MITKDNRAKFIYEYIKKNGLTHFDTYKRDTKGDMVEWFHLRDLGNDITVENIHKYVI